MKLKWKISYFKNVQTKKHEINITKQVFEKYTAKNEQKSFFFNVLKANHPHHTKWKTMLTIRLHLMCLTV